MEISGDKDICREEIKSCLIFMWVKQEKSADNNFQ